MTVLSRFNVPGIGKHALMSLRRQSSNACCLVVILRDISVSFEMKIGFFFPMMMK